MTTAVLTVVAIAFFAMYILRRRSRLAAEE